MEVRLGSLVSRAFDGQGAASEEGGGQKSMAPTKTET